MKQTNTAMELLSILGIDGLESSMVQGYTISANTDMGPTILQVDLEIIIQNLHKNTFDTTKTKYVSTKVTSESNPEYFI